MTLTTQLFLIFLSFALSSCGRFDFGSKVAFQANIPEAKYISVDGSSVGFGGCSPVKVSGWFSSDTPGGMPAGMTLALDGLRSGDRVFLDSACKQVADPTALPTSLAATTMTYYVRAASTGSVNLAVSSFRYSAVRLFLPVKLVPVSLAFAGSKMISLGAGKCSSANQVAILDGNGAPIVAASKTIKFIGGNGIVFADAACSAAITSLQVSNASQGTFYLKRTNVFNQMTSLTVSDANDPSISTDTLNITFPSVPIGLAISGGPASGDPNMVLGQCSSKALKISLVDADGNLTAVPQGSSPIVVSLTSPGGSATDFLSACDATGSIVTSVTFTSANSAGTPPPPQVVYARPASRSGAGIVATDSAGFLVPAKMNYSIDILPLLLHLTGPSTGAAGYVSASFTATLIDGGNWPYTTQSDVAITLTGMGTGAKLCADSLCQTTFASKIPAGSSSVDFYYLPSQSDGGGTTNLVVSSYGLTSASAPISISPRGPTSVTLSGPQSVNLGSCQTYIAAFSDKFGSIGPNFDTNFSFSASASTNGAAAFFAVTDANCSSPLGGMTVSAGVKSVSFKVQTLAFPSVALSLTQTSPTPATITSVPFAISNITQTVASVSFANAPSSVVSGSVSTAFQLSLKDGAGNDFYPSNYSLLLGISPAFQGLFCTSPDCKSGVLSGGNLSVSNAQTAIFYFQPTADTNTTKNVSVTVAGNGMTPNPKGDSSALAIKPRVPVAITFAGSTKVALGVCSLFTVGLVDGNGNPVVPANGSQTVTLSGSNGIFLGPDCSGTPLSNSGLVFGATETSKTVGIVARDFLNGLINASIAGSQVSGSITLSVARNPVGLGLQGTSTFSTGMVSPALAITPADKLGAIFVNPSGFTAINVSLTMSSGSATFCASASCDTGLSSLSVSIPVGAQSSSPFYVLSNVDLDTTVNIVATVTSPASVSGHSFPLSLQRKSLSLDTSFASDSSGKLSVSVNGYNQGDIQDSVYYNGKLVVAGWVATGGLKRLAVGQVNGKRSNGLGTLDTSGFGSYGTTVVNLGDQSWATSITTQVVAGTPYFLVAGVEQTGGSTPTNDPILLRFKADGSLDTSFRHVNGNPDPISVSGNQNPTAVLLGSDGTIYMVGSSDPINPNANNTSDLFITAFNAAGTIISTEVYDYSNSFDQATSALVQTIGSQDRILIGGGTGTGQSRDFLFMRVLGVRGTGGASVLSPDTAFGSGGFIQVDLGSVPPAPGKLAAQADFLRSMVAQPSGRVIAAGSRESSGSSNLALLGLNSDGSVDTSFGSSGLVLTDIAGSSAERAMSVALDPGSNAVYAFGTAGNNYLMARYTANGGTDSLSPASQTYAAGSPAPTAWSLVMGQDNHPLLAGSAGGQWSVYGLLR